VEKNARNPLYYFYKLAKALPEKYHHKNKGLKESSFKVYLNNAHYGPAILNRHGLFQHKTKDFESAG